MRSRFKTFGWHFAGSASVMLAVVGTLYVGWYRWPGWYLTGVLHILPILVGVDVALGPLVTLLIASPKKTSRALGRDIAVIVAVQLVALSYGAYTLWQGRPLYYAFSVNQLEVVQAGDIDPAEAARGRQSNPALAPHWYRGPRWIWAPLPEDQAASDAIVRSAVTGGSDVTDMPRYYRSWSEGLPELRRRLSPVGQSRFFSGVQRKRLAQRMRDLGLNPDEANSIPFTGRDVPLLAVFDLRTLRMTALLSAKP